MLRRLSLPGFPDGSFAWAKVRPHLPNAAEMPKLFVDYVGMGDSDKPRDHAYSTAERTDLVYSRAYLGGYAVKM
jgi:pimeloyl-ACP methyl ester carboxylesterase